MNMEEQMSIEKFKNEEIENMFDAAERWLKINMWSRIELCKEKAGTWKTHSLPGHVRYYDGTIRKAIFESDGTVEIIRKNGRLMLCGRRVVEGNTNQEDMDFWKEQYDYLSGKGEFPRRYGELTEEFVMFVYEHNFEI